MMSHLILNKKRIAISVINSNVAHKSNTWINYSMWVQNASRTLVYDSFEYDARSVSALQRQYGSWIANPTAHQSDIKKNLYSTPTVSLLLMATRRLITSVLSIYAKLWFETRDGLRAEPMAFGHCIESWMGHYENNVFCLLRRIEL